MYSTLFDAPTQPGEFRAACRMVKHNDQKVTWDRLENHGFPNDGDDALMLFSDRDEFAAHARKCGHKHTRHDPAGDRSKKLPAPYKGRKPVTSFKAFDPQLGEIGSWVEFLDYGEVISGQVWSKIDSRTVYVATGARYRAAALTQLREPGTLRGEAVA